MGEYSIVATQAEGECGRVWQKNINSSSKQVRSILLSQCYGQQCSNSWDLVVVGGEGGGGCGSRMWPKRAR